VGLKFELVLAGLIVVTSVLMMSVKLGEPVSQTNGDGKELEFYDTAFREVNATGFVSASYGGYGERVKGVLHVETFRYSDNDVRMLSAREAFIAKDKYRLVGDVKFDGTNGFGFRSEYIIYDRARRSVESVSPFYAYMPPNSVQGERMRYEIDTKTLHATKVKAMIVIETLKDDYGT
jgi:hypothetical protein